MKVVFYISKKRTNKKGVAPIYCRVTIDGKRSEISTGIFVNPLHWHNEKLAEVTHENVLQNAAISRMRNRLSELYYELKFKDKTVTAETITSLYTGKQQVHHTFLELMYEYLNYKKQQTDAYNTLRTYNARQKLVETYLQKIGRRNMPPEDFTLKFADDLLHHLIKEKKLHRNYANRLISFCKSVLTYGLRIDVIKINPIATIVLKHDAPPPIVALTRDELMKIYNYRFASQRLQHVADMYVFQAYTGLAYVDLFDFDYSKHVKIISGKKMIFKGRIKSKVEAVLPLFPVAEIILKKYHYNLPVITNQKYNAYIKEIADIVGIYKPLTTHTARKTFGMITLNGGFSLPTVSKMLGHTGVKITQSTYAQIDVTRIQTEMQGVRI